MELILRPPIIFFNPNTSGNTSRVTYADIVNEFGNS